MTHDLDMDHVLTLRQTLAFLALVLVVAVVLGLAVALFGPVALTLTATVLVPLVALCLIGFSLP